MHRLSVRADTRQVIREDILKKYKGMPNVGMWARGIHVNGHGWSHLVVTGGKSISIIDLSMKDKVKSFEDQLPGKFYHHEMIELKSICDENQFGFILIRRELILQCIYEKDTGDFEIIKKTEAPVQEAFSFRMCLDSRQIHYLCRWICG